MKAATQSLDEQVQSALAWLKRRSTKATLEGMARYAIPSDHVLPHTLSPTRSTVSAGCGYGR